MEKKFTIDVNNPKEIYYYQQISDSEWNFYLSPWGGAIIKNCWSDGKLLEFPNIRGLEMFEKENRKQFWIYLKLKIFQFNVNELFGVYICPECPSMKGTQELQVNQEPEIINQRLCLHSRVVSMKIGDWRRYWSVSLSPSDLLFNVIPNEDCNYKIFIPKSSPSPFLAGLVLDNSVSLLYCATKRQDTPFCSQCTTRKCHHHWKVLAFVESETGPSGDSTEEAEQDDYEPTHEEDEEDGDFNGHYMTKPPNHVRAKLYGYNFEDIIYPFSDSPEQQQVWLERVAGDVRIPDRLEPVFNINNRCRHDSLYDSRSEALVLESRTVCLFNDLGQRIFPSCVYARPTVGTCKCLQRFDGHRLLVWYLGQGRGAFIAIFVKFLINAFY